MSRKNRGFGALLTGAALGGLTLWLVRRRLADATGSTRSASDSWLPDDVLDLPPTPIALNNDRLLAEIFDRPHS